MGLSRILVDTSAYSWALRGLQEVVQPIRKAEFIALTPVVIGELLAGFIRGNQEQANREKLASFTNSARVSILPVTEETGERYASLLSALSEQGSKIPTNDIWIAASAMEHGLTLLTTDQHFKKCPLLRLVLVAPPKKP